MLMPVKRVNLVNLHAVESHQRAIDARLANWARWVRPSRQSWICPMFRQYRSKAWQWERPPVKDPIDTLDAMIMEKAVCALPEKHRQSIQWAYYAPFIPVARVLRYLGVNDEALFVLICDSRQILINRLQYK